MTPQLKIQEGKLIVDGNFEFEFGKHLYNPSTDTSTMDITFKWCPEVSMEAQSLMKDNQYVELMAEKLKQDFIEHLYKIGNKEPTPIKKPIPPPTKMLWEGENPTKKTLTRCKCCGKPKENISGMCLECIKKISNI
jgi:hypothetical protein